jgi:hypothetical protein
MKIVPIVEGYGEVEAVPILLRRLMAEGDVFHIQVASPIRKTRTELVTQDKLSKAIQTALLDPECAAILVLFDGDDDCPKELATNLQSWAAQAARGTPCQVVIAHREFEAWFLAAIESLRGKREIDMQAIPPNDPEAIRGAKERITKFMPTGRSYSETIDQAKLTAAFDFSSAYRRSRSFRKMAKAIAELLKGTGTQLDVWPPVTWQQSDE